MLRTMKALKGLLLEYCAYWNVPTFKPRKWKGEAQIKVKNK